VREAEALATGFSGYISIACLTLASRCVEIGNPDRIEALTDLALKRASSVRDSKFRKDRIRLVNAYRGWLARDLSDLGAVLEEFSTLADREMRMAFLDCISARCSWPPEAPDWKGLKALVPLALLDGSSLDAVLARLTGLRAGGLSEDELGEAVAVCAEHLMSGRPWEIRRYPEP
jgi:hypothetical protein